MEDILLLELAKENRKDFDADIVLAQVDGKLLELHKKVPEGSSIK